MKHNFIPLSHIGHGLCIPIGKYTPTNTKKEYPLSWKDSSWLQEFFERYALNPDTDLNGYIEVEPEGNIYRATLHITFEPQLECFRCDQSFASLVDTQVQTAFFIPESMKQQDPTHLVEIPQEELEAEFYYFNKTHLNLENFLLDILETSIPHYPDCQECSLS